MTSELSNALNPNIVQNRRRRSAYVPREQHVEQPRPEPPPVQPQPRNYTRHRSELELAVVDPPPLPPPPPPPLPARSVELPSALVVAPPHPPPPAPPAEAPLSTAHARTSIPFEHVVRAIVHTKRAADQERNRRAAWEQEQEAKLAQREAELQKQLENMKAEMALLKAVVTMQQHQNPGSSQDHVLMSAEQVEHAPPLPAPTAHIEEVPTQVISPSPPSEVQSPHMYDWSTYTPPNGPPPFVPTFIEGSSSSRPHTLPPNATYTFNYTLGPAPSPGTIHSPGVTSPAASSPASIGASPNGHASRKLRTPPPESPLENESSSDESDVPTGDGPRKRRNGHDTRCLTIQAAIRSHIYRCMEATPGDPLPDNHTEGVPLSDSEAVRFVWAKTARKSAHNANMKKRIIADLLANRTKLYKYVPEKDFDTKTLEVGFDQAFTTLRQKFRAQQDEAAASHMRMREDQKALKARRKDRKKTKLAARVESRHRLPVYAHSTFDGAFQLDCMSSEESDTEHPASLPSGEISGVRVLRVRGLLWRSTRLLQFFAALDAADPQSRSPSPSLSYSSSGEPQRKRRRLHPTERRAGLPKDEFRLPPKGIAGWMVSRRWIRESVLAGQYDIEEKVKDLVNCERDKGFDWGAFHILGDETEDEELEDNPEPPGPYIPRSDTSYALANALHPPV